VGVKLTTGPFTVTVAAPSIIAFTSERVIRGIKVFHRDLILAQYVLQSKGLFLVVGIEEENQLLCRSQERGH